MTAHTTATAAAADLALADLAGSWMIDLARRTAPGTLRAYNRGVTAFIAWHAAQAPGMPVTAASLDRKTAAAFLADVLGAGAAPATARLRYQALRQFSAWLTEEGETDADVAARPAPAQAGQAPRRLGSAAASWPRSSRRARPRPARTGGKPSRPCATRRWCGCSPTPACGPARLLALTTDDVDLRRRRVDRHPGQGRQAPGVRVRPGDRPGRRPVPAPRPPRPQARAHARRCGWAPPTAAGRTRRCAARWPSGPPRQASPGSTRTGCATPRRRPLGRRDLRRGRDGLIRVEFPPDARPVHRGHRAAAGGRVVRPVLRRPARLTAALGRRGGAPSWASGFRLAGPTAPTARARCARTAPELLREMIAGRLHRPAGAAIATRLTRTPSSACSEPGALAGGVPQGPYALTHAPLCDSSHGCGCWASSALSLAT